jgi:GDPmannose 4,6-dehydratase
MTKALITGATGMDASYLAELLLSKGYEVWSVMRQSSSLNTWRIDHLLSEETSNSLQLVYGDILDLGSLIHIMRKVQPDEVYHLAAQSHVKVSFEVPIATSLVDAIGALNVFEAARIVECGSRIYQASSSEMFGCVRETPQTEMTPFHPRSPYACSKVHAYFSAMNHREAYGMHISNGILFNHTSPRRGETFVEKKIVMAVARILRGEQKVLKLGNLDAKRDFGWAPEYVEAMWRILQQPVGDDYVIATGETHTIREIVDIAFEHVNLNPGDYVRIDDNLRRPSEVDLLCGNAEKADRVLGWRPRKLFREIITTMLDYEIKHGGARSACDITWKA